MAKLDVVATVSEAYKGAWSHLGDMVKLVWAPVILYLGGMMAVISLIQSRMLQVPPDPTPEQVQAFSAELVETLIGWPLVVIFLLTLFVWPIIAVAWHRFILLGETGASTFNFRFGQREARFLLLTIFISLLSLPSWIVNSLSMSVEQGTVVATLLGLVSAALYLAGIFYTIRLTLLLPAAAVDEPLNVGKILSITKGNFWRLLAAQVLTGAIFVMIFLVASFVLGTVALVMGLTAIVQPMLAGIMLMGWMILSVAVVSVAYRDLSQAS